MKANQKLENLSAWEIGELVNNKILSPTEVVKYFLDRIEKLNANVNAFVDVRAAYAFLQAKMLEERSLVENNIDEYIEDDFVD